MRQEQAQIVRRISGLGEISDRYEAILCDIWGVVHNGVASFAPASEALVSFRRRGGAVILITNAPRPFPPVKRQVMKLGVSPDAFDGIVTSGDVTVGLMERQAGRSASSISGRRAISACSTPPKRPARAQGSYPSKTLNTPCAPACRNDESETVDDYESELSAMAARGMPMICANPDIVIHRGDTLIYCAGALARRYEELGGSVVYAGKPYAPIYDLALAVAARARGAPVDKRRALAIGDGMGTDIAGAAKAGLDALFVTGGIHRSVHGDTPDFGRRSR